MARILCLTSDVPGVLYAGVELGRRLARAGHEVVYGSFPAAREVAVANGLEFMALEPSRYEDFLAEDARGSELSRLARIRSRRARALESLAVGGLGRRVREIAPELILVDGELHEQIIAVSASGVPVALLNSFVSIWRRPALPPPHHLARPGVGWRGSRAGIWLLWRALRLGKLRRTAWQRLRRLGCDRLSLLRRLARDSGFDLTREIDRGQWLIPFTYRRFPVLSLHALEFEFPHRPPERVRYVGPMLLEERPGRPLNENERAELEAVFERRRCGGRALVYAGFGSFFSTELGLLRRLIAAAAERPGLELVISLGGRLRPAELGPLPPGVRAFGWLPQTEVLRHADAAVTHGGINTVDECVLRGVPMLVYCGFETDMAGITSRVVHHGLGIAGDGRRDGAAEIGARLDRLLSEPSYRAAVGKMRAAYLAYAEERVAERAVTELLGACGARSGR